LALEDLAATPDRQRQRLKEIGTYPSVDEFGLEYDNWAQASWQCVESGEITETTHKAILQLNDRIAEFGGKENAAEWDVGALTTSANWSDVRDRARNILLALGNP
jgi:hypothetical protein